MSKNTKIEWADHTFNPWMGCQKVSPGCDNCYAEQMMDKRMHKASWVPGAPRVRTSAANWNLPLRWNAQAEAFAAQHGRRQRVFCASLADVFDNAVPVQWRIDLMKLIVETPRLDWLLLTKRIGNAAEMLDVAFRAVHAQRETWADNVPPNVWIGATITSQAEADRDIPKLLAVPARVRFLSMEPLLGPVQLPRYIDRARSGAFDVWTTGIDWVIVGGESGPGARPMHPDWARSLRDQCAAAGVPFLFKQWGEWAPGSGDFGSGRFRTAAVALDGRVVDGGYDTSGYPKGSTSADCWSMVHVAGKKTAGRLLDGQQHDGFPEDVCSIR